MEDLKTTIEWELSLPSKNTLHFPFHIIPDIKKLEWENYNFYPSGELLGLLQDTFYVTHWSSIQEENNHESNQKELNDRDEYWNIFRWIWSLFAEVLRENYQNIVNTQNSTDDDYSTLKREKGHNYQHFIERMGEPFVTRYQLYTVISLVVPTVRFQYENCTNIVCYFDKFVSFWNDSIKLLSNIVSEIQHYQVEGLRHRFEHIINDNTHNKEYENFKKDYLIEGDGKCFSVTTVHNIDGSKQDLVCFSGIFFKDEISKAINKIVDGISKDPNFNSPKLVTVNDTIRYYIDDKNYITYGQAKQCCSFIRNSKYNRMFSCCERKTFAFEDYNWDECTSYIMIVKYPPCELCEIPVAKHNKKYNGQPIPGKKNNDKPLKDLEEFNILAKCIHTGGCRNKP